VEDMNFKNILTAGLGGVVTAAILYLANVLTIVPAIIIPSNAVVPFLSTECPDGWAEIPETYGRVIIGTGKG
jgi:hypothetical protein